MNLFHAFPRPPHSTNESGQVVRQAMTDEDCRKGLEILRLILTHGLLCTPERFKLYPNYNAEIEEKKRLADANQPHDEIIQSRACFTLADSIELSKENELSHGERSRYAAHIDLFGEFAIGLDPLQARSLGIMPTIYYYRHDIDSFFRKTAGLGTQIVERLDEIRTVFSILSYIEAHANAGDEDELVFPSPERLKSMGVRVRYQSEIEAEIADLKAQLASDVYRLFNTDRVPAWNIVDFIEMMLSLYQTTDSTIEDAPLAFFQQREWRLVHHMMQGLMWVGIGNHADYRNSLAKYYPDSIREIKNFIRKNSPQKTEEQLNWFFNHCWILAGTNRLHLRNFVREIVVPERFCSEAEAIVDSLDFISARPVITVLPPRWRIALRNGVPYIVRVAEEL